MQQLTKYHAGIAGGQRVEHRYSAWLLQAWLGIRLLTLIWAALVSAIQPFNDLERAVPLWPPSLPFSAWLERAVLSPLQRWDVKYFVSIVERGYRIDNGTAQFHPLLPWLATPIYWLTGQPLLALVLVSSSASLALVVAFERLARLDLDPATASLSTLLLLFAPLGFVLFVPYTEPLFLLWAVLSFWWARRRSWWLAGLAGGLAVLTRQQGVFLALPLAWELWESSNRSWRGARAAWRSWLALLLLPAAMGFWLLFRAAALGDLRANFVDPQALIYSLLISPSASKVVPIQAFLPPWQSLALAVGKFWREPELSLGIDLVLGAGFIVLLILAWPALRPSYRVYVLTITLVSFSYHTGPYFPYMGLPRHLLLAFPVFIGLGPVCCRRPLASVLIVSGVCMMLVLQMLYGLQGWPL